MTDQKRDDSRDIGIFIGHTRKNGHDEDCYSDGVTECSYYSDERFGESSIVVYCDTSSSFPVKVALAILDDNNLNETANELREKLKRTEEMLEFAKLKIANIWSDEFGGTVDDNLARVSVMIGRNTP